MATQLVTVSPDGAVSSLRFGKGLDLRRIGKTEVSRATEILFDEHLQKWFIRFLQGNLKDTFATIQTLFDSRMPPEEFAKCIAYTEPDSQDTDMLLYPEYEQAVAAEISIIQGFTLSGYPEEVIG